METSQEILSDVVITPSIDQTIDTEASPSPMDTSTFLTDDGKFSQSFLDNLPDGLGKHSILQKYKNPTDLINGAINAQSLSGKKAEEFWTSTDESVVAKRKEIMGVPANVDGYDFDSEGFPEPLLETANARASAFKEFALEKGYPKQMVEDILKFDKEGAIAAFAGGEASLQQKIEATETDLRSEWKGDAYEYNIAKVKNTLEHMGLESWIEDPAFGNNSERIKEFYEKIIPLVSSDTIIAAKQTQNFATISDSLDDVEGRIRSFRGQTSSPEYKSLVKERGDLLARIRK